MPDLLQVTGVSKQYVSVKQVLCALLGCYLIRVAAGRLFKAGMVMYGKEPSIKDMVRWVCKPE
ncbi:hypothetical protein CBQ28_16425 [Pseudoalteromonas sp. GCY]|uniref:hypothetical protein n=1 Tax=Pseudoalteromonas sp. GCY TaxID=2003316 RepID=UPI000C030E93|nr:hypothetical protein [Pseudoalteromonas sp. GCY]PHI36056.1 hypothetical protein CBQ28_16425 [Pseudoalteromonas sp. GCY]